MGNESLGRILCTSLTDNSRTSHHMFHTCQWQLSSEPKRLLTHSHVLLERVLPAQPHSLHLSFTAVVMDVKDGLVKLYLKETQAVKDIAVVNPLALVTKLWTIYTGLSNTQWMTKEKKKGSNKREYKAIRTVRWRRTYTMMSGFPSSGKLRKSRDGDRLSACSVKGIFKRS